jgi:hypothetical protein
MGTGWVWHERYAWHDARGLTDSLEHDSLFEPQPSLESGVVKRRLRNLVDASGLLAKLTEVRATVLSVDAAFWSDPSVLTVSLHQEDLFAPGSGLASEIGEGAGEGLNVNVELPAGSGRAAYLAALDQVVVPALERLRPSSSSSPADWTPASTTRWGA